MHTLGTPIHTRGRRWHAPHPRGALALAKRDGPIALEDAANAAFELRVPTLPLPPRYLERRLPLTLRQVEPLVRQLTVYRNLIGPTTGEPRLRQAQQQRQPPIDSLSAIVGDALLDRQDRVLARCLGHRALS